MTTPTLYIGNRNYSSWSLRPWLCLMWSGIAFDEREVELDQEGYGRGEISDVLKVSPSGRVPVLHAGDLIVWDSLAIAEWAAERATVALWPRDPDARAIARSLTCEMHAGFAAVRSELPMNMRRRTRAFGLSSDANRELARLADAWRTARERFGANGPYLFGARTIADAFFTPVATRLRTYDIALPSVAAAYRDTLLADDALREWERRALAKPAVFSRANVDSIYATTKT